MREEEDFKNGEEGNGDNGNGRPKIEYKLPDYLKDLDPSLKQTLVNLNVLASRARYYKRCRQQVKNYIKSVGKTLAEHKSQYDYWTDLEKNIKDFQDQIDRIEKNLEVELEKVPIWMHFLRNIKGMGPVTGGAIVACIGIITRFATISSLRKYSGWFPVDGKAARLTSGENCRFSTRLKQILYHFVDCIIKAKDPVYYPMYVRFKEEIYNKHPEYRDRKATKGKRIEGIPKHVDLMARRKTIQMFLSDIFCIWRDLEGLPQTTPYAIGILRHEGFIDPLKNQHYKK